MLLLTRIPSYPANNKGLPEMIPTQIHPSFLVLLLGSNLNKEIPLRIHAESASLFGCFFNSYHNK